MPAPDIPPTNFLLFDRGRRQTASAPVMLDLDGCVADAEPLLTLRNGHQEIIVRSGAGTLGKATGTRVETIRFYERIVMLPKPPRTNGNRRTHGEEHVCRLGFVRRVGSRIGDCRIIDAPLS